MLSVLVLFGASGWLVLLNASRYLDVISKYPVFGQSNSRHSGNVVYGARKV